MAFGEQYDRTLRWLSLFREIDEGREHTQNSEYYIDVIYAFYQNCFHLKDWLKSDGSVTSIVSKKSIEAAVNSSANLRLCGDICNGTKHVGRFLNDWSGVNPVPGPQRFHLSLGVGEPPKISLKWQIDTDEGPMDAFVLAEQCIADWDAFLKANALL